MYLCGMPMRDITKQTDILTSTLQLYTNTNNHIIYTTS